jgi:hypothetical protein
MSAALAILSSTTVAVLPWTLSLGCQDNLSSLCFSTPEKDAELFFNLEYFDAPKDMKELSHFAT